MPVILYKYISFELLETFYCIYLPLVFVFLFSCFLIFVQICITYWWYLLLIFTCFIFVYCAIQLLGCKIFIYLLFTYLIYWMSFWNAFKKSKVNVVHGCIYIIVNCHIGYAVQWFQQSHLGHQNHPFGKHILPHSQSPAAYSDLDYCLLLLQRRQCPSKNTNKKIIYSYFIFLLLKVILLPEPYYLRYKAKWNKLLL